MSFNLRSWVHDNVAIPEAVRQLESLGYVTIRQGHEEDKAGIRNFVAGNRNNTSLIIRYKPDLLAKLIEYITAWEVKCDLGDHSNFAVEFDSYITMIEYYKTGDTFYAFIDCPPAGKDHVVSSSVYCELNRVPFPRVVFIPKRRGYMETLKYIRDKYPTIEPKPIEYNGNGSGTAYFLLSKNWPGYRQWSELSPVKPVPPEPEVQVEQLSLFQVKETVAPTSYYND